MDLKMEKKWTAPNIFNFLDHLERYPILWDTCHADYRNRSLKEGAFAELLRELQDEEGFPDIDSICALKARLKNIKDTYAVQLRKVLAFPVEAGRDYKPKLIWYDRADSFFRHSITRKQCLSRKPLRRKSTRQPVIVDNTFEVNEFPESPYFENVEPPQKIRTRTVEPDKTPVEKSLQQYISDEFDEYDYFGKIVAVTLRKLNQEDAWKAEDEIGQVLRKYRRRKQQIFTDFVEVSPEHLLADQFNLNNSSSSDCRTVNASEVSSKCLENEDTKPSKRPFIHVIKVKPTESRKSSPKVYLVS